MSETYSISVFQTFRNELTHVTSASLAVLSLTQHCQGFFYFQHNWSACLRVCLKPVMHLSHSPPCYRRIITNSGFNKSVIKSLISYNLFTTKVPVIYSWNSVQLYWWWKSKSAWLSLTQRRLKCCGKTDEELTSSLLLVTWHVMLLSLKHGTYS